MEKLSEYPGIGSSSPLVQEENLERVNVIIDVAVSKCIEEENHQLAFHNPNVLLNSKPLIHEEVETEILGKDAASLMIDRNENTHKFDADLLNEDFFHLEETIASDPKPEAHPEVLSQDKDYHTETEGDVMKKKYNKKTICET